MECSLCNAHNVPLYRDESSNAIYCSIECQTIDYKYIGDEIDNLSREELIEEILEAHAILKHDIDQYAMGKIEAAPLQILRERLKGLRNKIERPTITNELIYILKKLGKYNGQKKFGLMSVPQIKASLAVNKKRYRKKLMAALKKRGGRNARIYNNMDISELEEQLKEEEEEAPPKKYKDPHRMQVMEELIDILKKLGEYNERTKKTIKGDTTKRLEKKLEKNKGRYHDSLVAKVKGHAGHGPFFDEMYANMDIPELEEQLRILTAPPAQLDGNLYDDIQRKEYIQQDELFIEFIQPQIDEFGNEVPTLESFLELQRELEKKVPELTFELVEAQKEQVKVIPIGQPTYAEQALKLIRKTDSNPLFDWAERYQRRLRKEEEELRLGDGGEKRRRPVSPRDKEDKRIKLPGSPQDPYLDVDCRIYAYLKKKFRT